MKKNLFFLVLAAVLAWQFLLKPRDMDSLPMLSDGGIAISPDATIDIRDENGRPVDLASLPPEVRDAILKQAGVDGGTGGGGHPAVPPGPPAAKGPFKQFSFRDRSPTHTTVNVSGWTVILERALSDSNTALANRVLTQLERHLDRIAEALPAAAVTDLRAVPIWINLNSPSPRAGQYHWSAESARAAGEDPQKAGGMEITRAAEFIEMEWEQPWMVLHELSHAYHHRILGLDNPTIRNAYQNALNSGIYNAVRHVGGGTDRAYALTDEREYFAELTEAYFGKNDFFPFNRAELRAHDPTGYRMIESVWSVR